MDFSDAKKPKWLNRTPPPTRKRIAADGTVLTEKLNPMPCKIKMVDPAGFVVEVSLANGWNQRNPNSEYAINVRAEKLAAGFLPYAECPIATGRLPAAKGDKACAGKFSDEECCPHLQAVIDARKAAHSKRQAEQGHAMMTTQDKMVATFEKMIAANLTKSEGTGGLKTFGG